MHQCLVSTCFAVVPLMSFCREPRQNRVLRGLRNHEPFQNPVHLVLVLAIGHALLNAAMLHRQKRLSTSLMYNMSTFDGSTGNGALFEANHMLPCGLRSAIRVRAF